jgi:hypothetical protein
MTSSPSSRRQRRRPARSQQRSQRQQGRTAAQRQHTDYAQDYVFVRRDMRRIAIWSILLFVCMFGAYFFL